MIDREQQIKSAIALATALEAWVPVISSGADCSAAGQTILEAAQFLTALASQEGAQAGEAGAWDRQRLRDHARDYGWYIREGASVLNIHSGGWIHPFSVTAQDIELLALLNTTPPAPDEAVRVAVRAEQEAIIELIQNGKESRVPSDQVHLHGETVVVDLSEEEIIALIRARKGGGA